MEHRRSKVPGVVLKRPEHRGLCEHLGLSLQPDPSHLLVILLSDELQLMQVVLNQAQCHSRVTEQSGFQVVSPPAAPSASGPGEPAAAQVAPPPAARLQVSCCAQPCTDADPGGQRSGSLR